MVWIAFALMTGAAVLCVVWPMSKARPTRWQAHDGDLRFYRDQMATIEQDVASGLVAPAEAAGSRAEIGRRLIAAADRSVEMPAAAGRRRRLLAAAIAVMVAIPAVSLALYLRIGSPEQGDLPLSARVNVPATNDIADAIAKVESHLVSHPEDGRGFELLAPLYLRLGRYADAVHAFERSLALRGETAERRSGYAQALMLQADGVVTADARAAFEMAAKDDPAAPQPQFFLGMAAAQDGDKARAREIWSRLVETAPAGAPWLPMVQARLGALDGAASPVAPASGPASPQGAAIAALPAGPQMQAIRGMVDGLAARLSQNGQDPDGWLRLVRAYAVLGDKDKAVTALGDARRNLSADPKALSQLQGLAHELGLEG